MKATVRSSDGTSIAFERSGDGPAVVLVSGALGNRRSNVPLAGLLAARFTVFNYDRRGRGDSDDTPPYAVERELEDLQAIIDEAGGTACVFGTSSGGNLALEAAAHGLAITKLALWEPNFLVDDARPPLPHDYVERLIELASVGRRGAAVELFLTDAVGLPAEFVATVRQGPAWPAMESEAHTLAYDGMVVGDSMSGKPLAAERWAGVVAPTLVIDGGQTPWLTVGAQAIAEALAGAKRRTLEGQPHDVAPEAIASVLNEFFVT